MQKEPSIPSPSPACACEAMVEDPSGLSPVCLAQLWVFRHLGGAEVEALLASGTRRKVPKGENLFRQGDPAEDLFLITGGRVKLTKLFEDGREITLDIRKAGDFVGETLLSGDADYPVSAWSLEETLTCGFKQSQFERLVLAHPRIGLQVIRNMSERITWLSERVGGLAAGSIEERLYQVLSDMAKAHGVREAEGTLIGFPLTHEDLGFLIGAHRVSVTRAIKELRQAGKILAQGKLFLVPDP